MLHVSSAWSTGHMSSKSDNIGMWAGPRVPIYDGIIIIIFRKGLETCFGRSKASLIVLLEIIAQPTLKFKGLEYSVMLIQLSRRVGVGGVIESNDDRFKGIRRGFDGKGSGGRIKVCVASGCWRKRLNYAILPLLWTIKAKEFVHSMAWNRFFEVFGFWLQEKGLFWVGGENDWNGLVGFEGKVWW